MFVWENSTAKVDNNNNNDNGYLFHAISLDQHIACSSYTASVTFPIVCHPPVKQYSMTHRNTEFIVMELPRIMPSYI